MTTVQVASSEPGKTYTLRLVGSTWQCECIGYAKRQRCRHQAIAASQAAPTMVMSTSTVVTLAESAGRESAERYAASVDWPKVMPASAWDCPAGLPVPPAGLSTGDLLAWEMACDVAANERWRELCSERGITPERQESGWEAEARAEGIAYRRSVARYRAARFGRYA